MKSGSHFTGTSALDMAAAEVLGCTPAWFCEHEPSTEKNPRPSQGAAKLLAHHYPHTPNLGDITAVDWTAVEPVEVLTSGFPCTDISNAGPREGITGARSGLWSHTVNAIRVLRPRYVLIENVSALVVRGLDRVLADLASLGFDAEWTTVRASDVGAPHRRERIFIAAQDTNRAARTERRQPAPGQAESGRARADARGRGRTPAAHAEGVRRHQGRSEPARLLGRSDVAERGAAPTHADRAGRQGTEPAQRLDVPAWGGYEPAIRRWEAILGRPAPTPTVVGTRGGRVLNPALPEWMMGLPAGWITSVPGLSRNDQLKLAGNGVVPQQAIAAFRHLLPLLAGEAIAA